MGNLFTDAFMKENMMGPNAVTLLEELSRDLPLSGCRRILDLGCGRGLTSMALASQYDATVFATDLWIPASDNFARFEQMGFGERIVPIHANATDLPFADGYFDALVSVDSYHYYGREKHFLDGHIAPLLKPGGLIGLVVPGLKVELAEMDLSELYTAWTKEDLQTLHSVPWWRELLSESEHTQLVSIREMDCFWEAWEDWLSCDNPYAVGDREAMRAGAGAHMNLIAVVCKRI